MVDGSSMATPTSFSSIPAASITASMNGKVISGIWQEYLHHPATTKLTRASFLATSLPGSLGRYAHSFSHASEHFYPTPLPVSLSPASYRGRRALSRMAGWRCHSSLPEAAHRCHHCFHNSCYTPGPIPLCWLSRLLQQSSILRCRSRSGEAWYLPPILH